MTFILDWRDYIIKFLLVDGDFAVTYRFYCERNKMQGTTWFFVYPIVSIQNGFRAILKNMSSNLKNWDVLIYITSIKNE